MNSIFLSILYISLILVFFSLIFPSILTFFFPPRLTQILHGCCRDYGAAVAAEGVVDKIVEDSDLSNPSVKKIKIMLLSPLPQSN